MAEALARHYAGSRIEAHSAGLSPLDRIPALTLQVLEERGVPAVGQHTKGLLSLIDEQFDVVINMSGFPVPRFGGVRVEEWEIDDPYGRPVGAYRATRDAIDARVRALLDSLGAVSPA
jgi:arsenate reductase (thioredoxin)